MAFLTYETEFVLFLAVLENSVLPMGLDSSHATLNVTYMYVKILNFRRRHLFTTRKTPTDVGRGSLCDVKGHK